MKLPRKPYKGDEILLWAQQMWDYVQSIAPKAGPGMHITETSKGTILSVQTPPRLAAATATPIPLHIRDSRPPYIANPATSPPEPTKRYFIEWGTLNNLVATNWDAHFDVSATTYFFAKATLRTTGTLLVTSWEIVTGPAFDSHTTPDWPVGSPRPVHAVVLLGQVQVNGDGAHTIIQSGGGSIVLTEHVTSISPGSGAGDVQIGKELTYYRVAY